MPGGRPSDYTPELAAELCSYLSTGESLRKACARESMPCTTTVFVWLSKKPEFQEQYARAKAESADAFAEDMLDIADESSRDTIVGEDGVARQNSEWISRSRLRVDTRKWLASKLKPKRYGDRLDATVEHSGGLTVTVANTDTTL